MNQNWSGGFPIMVRLASWKRLTHRKLLTWCIDIPYPSPADRKDLESAVKVNWNSKVQKPLGQAADQATDQWHQAKDWIFDTYVQNGRAYYFVHH